MMEVLNPFASEGCWYKGNLHTHTTRSDGGRSPEEMERIYREAGYDFLAITDHGTVTEVEGLSDGEFLVLKGVELNGDESDVGSDIHICGFGLERDGDPPRAPKVQEAIDWIREHGGEAVIAHPYWSSLVVSDLLRWEGHLGVEVFNTTCHAAVAKGCSAVHWDDLLARGRMTLGLAVDDCHGGRDFTTAWVMVKAAELSREAIMASLRSGLFYSSWGPTIHDVSVGEGKVTVRTSPVREINFVAQGSEGRHLVPEGELALTGGECAIKPGYRYLRVECQDLEGRWAWGNPVVFR